MQNYTTSTFFTSIADVYFSEAIISLLIALICLSIIGFLIWWYIIAKKNIK